LAASKAAFIACFVASAAFPPTFLTASMEPLTASTAVLPISRPSSLMLSSA